MSDAIFEAIDRVIDWDYVEVFDDDDDPGVGYANSDVLVDRIAQRVRKLISESTP